MVSIIEIPYTIFRVSKKTEKRLKIVSIILGVPIVIPYLTSWILFYFDIDPIWFNKYFDNDIPRNGLISGPYLFFAGIFLFCIGLLIGNDLMKYHLGADDKTHVPFGHIIVICQSFAPLLSLYGLFTFLVAFSE